MRIPIPILLPLRLCDVSTLNVCFNTNNVPQASHCTPDPNFLLIDHLKQNTFNPSSCRRCIFDKLWIASASAVTQSNDHSSSCRASAALKLYRRTPNLSPSFPPLYVHVN